MEAEGGHILAVGRTDKDHRKGALNQMFVYVGILFPVYIVPENTKTKTTYLGFSQSKND